MRRSRAISMCGGLLLLTIVGCNSATPTLPLPPPVAMVGSPNTQGLVAVEGEVKPRAYVVVFNERIESGVITRADEQGRFMAEIEAAIGDTLTVWQEEGNETGERKELVVLAPR